MNQIRDFSRDSTWGQLYAQALGLIEHNSWWELKERFDGGSLGLVEALILIHPAWYTLNDLDECPVRGNRSFGNTAVSFPKCESHVIWDYQCPLDAGQPHLDHLFPWSLGGPTTSTNAIWLCPPHNQAKGSDWHEVVAPVRKFRWFDTTLSRVESALNGLGA